MGHFALGYLLGKGSSKLAKVKVNLPLLLTASVLPDVDLILRFLMHRGPTHSFITITVLMIPFFAVYRKRAIPYYAALLSHILIGDFFTGGIELLWPISQNWFQALNYAVTSLPIQITELALFAVTLPIMYKLKDLQSLFKGHNMNWVLIIPLGAVIGPLFALGRGGESALPSLLVIPSIFYIVLFTYSILIDIVPRFNSKTNKNLNNVKAGTNFPNSSIPNY
ncbi:MAG TPA: metal-dependent hydrolase [Candidatus Acidoferrum sp.]|nr:metal-dependent hydrolase [Candidatus Acidoferrum sp.]